MISVDSNLALWTVKIIVISYDIWELRNYEYIIHRLAKFRNIAISHDMWEARMYKDIIVLCPYECLLIGV